MQHNDPTATTAPPWGWGTRMSKPEIDIMHAQALADRCREMIEDLAERTRPRLVSND